MIILNCFYKDLRVCEFTCFLAVAFQFLTEDDQNAIMNRIRYLFWLIHY